MNLYVWEGAFACYFGGIAFAVADTKEEAIKAIGRAHGDMETARRELNFKPKVYKLPRKRAVGFYMWGGD